MDRGCKQTATADEAHPEYRIGQVVKELDLGQYTLKHYERAGLIEPSTSEAGVRFYTREDFGKIITIRSLRRLRFSVEEVGELVAQDAPGVLEAMEAKLADNERVIAELQDANHLLHRHVQSLRQNLERSCDGLYNENTPGLIFVTHFRGDTLEGGSELLDSAVWRDVYERSLIGMRIERDAVGGEGLAGCWWGLVPLGDQTDVRAAMAAERPSDEVHIIDVLPGPAIVLSLEAPTDSSVFDCLRAAALGALENRDLALGGDVVAIADSVHREGEGGRLTLTLRVPVER